MLKHRTRRPVLSPCPSHARPRPRALTGVRSLAAWAQAALLVVYETTARTALQVWLRRSLERVVRASGGPTARPHATGTRYTLKDSIGLNPQHTQERSATIPIQTNNHATSEPHTHVMSMKENKFP